MEGGADSNEKERDRMKVTEASNQKSAKSNSSSRSSPWSLPTDHLAVVIG